MFTFLATDSGQWGGLTDFARPFWQCNGWDRWMALDTMFMLNDLDREGLY